MRAYASQLVKVFLLDDHDLVRRGLRDLLSAARDIQVVGDASSTYGAARAILDAGTDVMVLDVQLQDGTGIEVCREVRAEDPSVRGLLVTSYDDDQALAATLLAGAEGYVVKASQGADIIGAVRRLGGGRSLVDQGLRERVTSELRARIGALRLPESEQQLLGAVVDGLTDREIADRTGTDVDAVRRQVGRLVGAVVSAAGDPGPPAGPGSPGRHRAD